MMYMHLKVVENAEKTMNEPMTVNETTQVYKVEVQVSLRITDVIE